MQAVRIREWRKRLGLTQEEAARRIGVSRVTIQNWEGGATPISEAAQQRMRRIPEYGPVILHYAHHLPLGAVGPEIGDVKNYTEPYRNNDAAMKRVDQLHGLGAYSDFYIVDEAGETIWNKDELKAEYRRWSNVGDRDAGLADRLFEIGRRFRERGGLESVLTDDDLYDENGLPK